MAESTDLPTSRWRTRIGLVLLAAVIVPLGATLLTVFPPSEYSFYPGCFFNRLTGLHCPGCGATRSLAALLHGDIAQAFAWNPLFVIALPLLALTAFNTYYVAWTGKRLPYRMPGWAIMTLMVVIVSYWVIRNIDIYPLTLLAPHPI